MCGIAGIISFSRADISTEQLCRMSDSIAHRGPDGEGHWINKTNTVGFGHRRLAIIDLTDAGAQPMHYSDHYTIVHNGEIYNYIELRTFLKNKGYRFRSQSDTEVILAAYDYWKGDCVQYLDGMFAFAIWDEKEQSFFAARDRFGEKPFYYAFENDCFYFGSELKALWVAGVPKIPNEPMLYNFLTLGYTQNPADAYETAFKNIKKLPAHHYLIYRRGDLSVYSRSYWDVAIEKGVDVNEEKALTKFIELLKTSVAMRLRSDVAVGSSLSGGLDSSSIVSLVHELIQDKKKIKTFSAVFPGYENDESDNIKVVKEKFEVDNFQTQANFDGFISDFEKLCHHQEEPFQSSSIYAQYKVFEEAKKQGTKVLLDGQGADEILAGYHKYYHWYWQELFSNDKKALEIEMKAAEELGIQADWDWKNKLAAVFPGYASGFIETQRKRKQRIVADLSKDFIRHFDKSYYEMPENGFLNDVLYYNTCRNGLEELLRYADRNSMAHGREVRLPFLDHHLVEYVFSLPSHFKIHKGWSKWILRESVQKKLPAAIAWRKDKVGFETPQKEWMQNKVLQDYIQEAKKKLVSKGVLDAVVLNKKIQPQTAHAADNFDWRYLISAQLLF